MLVRNKWQSLDDKDKLLFVILARIKEEKDHYESIKEFYDERI